MVKFIMDDGYEIYTSIDGIPLMTNYLDIITTTTSPNRCVYLDYDHNNAIVRNCREIEKMAIGDQDEQPAQPAEEQPAEGSSATEGEGE